MYKQLSALSSADLCCSVLSVLYYWSCLYMKAVKISAGIEIPFRSFIAHTLTFLMSWHYYTLILRFKSGGMSCANEKSFLPLKDPRFFCIVIVWICSEVLFVLACVGVKIRWNVMLVLTYWCIIGKVWSSALNRIDHRPETRLK